MKKLHIALSTDNIEKTVLDYTQRLGCEPCVVIAGEYALWRTDCLNVSVRHDMGCAAGSLRHLGWEDSDAKEFSQETDVNGIVWERFNAENQAEEIREIWQGIDYQPS